MDELTFWRTKSHQSLTEKAMVGTYSLLSHAPPQMGDLAIFESLISAVRGEGRGMGWWRKILIFETEP